MEGPLLLVGVEFDKDEEEDELGEEVVVGREGVGVGEAGGEEEDVGWGGD